MSKAADMAKVSVKGGFHLLWGLVASTVISAVGTIIIAWLLGESNYGIYTIALTAPNLIATFRDMGVNSAMIRYTAQYNAENEAAKVRGIFVSGLIFETLPRLGALDGLFSAFRLSSHKRFSTPRHSSPNPSSLLHHTNRGTPEHGNSSVHRHRENAP